MADDSRRALRRDTNCEVMDLFRIEGDRIVGLCELMGDPTLLKQIGAASA